jgi:UDP-2,3-diacylglucosamine hydrolase
VKSQVSTLGIIAGGGELPLEVARAAAAAGREVFIMAVSEFAEDIPEPFASERNSIAKFGRSIAALRRHGCKDLVFVGHFARPRDKNLKIRPDLQALWFLVSNFGVLRRSNDGIHRAFASTFERRGFRVLSPLQVVPSLAANHGYLTETHAAPEVEAGFEGALGAARAHGTTGQGQAIVMHGTQTIATETRAGTDAMLRGLTVASARGAVLVKSMSPDQLPTMDPPAIGVQTIELAKAAGLAGIVVEAGKSVIVRPDQVKDAADKAGIFVFGAASQ